MSRMRGTLDLAVEFLARAGGAAVDEDRAVDAVRTVPVMRLFRLGVSLIGKVRALGHALVRRGPFAALAHLDLVEEPEATVLAALSKSRPLFSSLLDDPPSAGERPFESLADIARVTAAIQRAAVAQAMLLGLGIRPEHLLPAALEGLTPADANAIDTALLARTALVLILSRNGNGSVLHSADDDTPEADRGFRALTATEIAAFARHRGRKEAARAPGKSAPAPREVPNSLPVNVAAKARRILEQVAPPRMSVAAVEIAARWLESLSPLEPVLTIASKRKEEGG
jgi:hypothetical protein